MQLIESRDVSQDFIEVLLILVNTSGIGRHSRLSSRVCYRWHQTYEDFSAISKGRNVTVGEMHWVVLIRMLDYHGP